MTGPSIHVDTFFGRFTFRRLRRGCVLLTFAAADRAYNDAEEIGRLWVRTRRERAAALERVLSATGLWHPRPVARVEAFLEEARQ